MQNLCYAYLQGRRVNLIMRELNQNVQEISQIGRALYYDPKDSYHYSLETLSTVKLLELDENSSLERATSALIFQALKKNQNPQTPEALNHPFFQLDPYDRFILSALHLCQWPYEKCSRILNIHSTHIAKRAWTARTRLMEKLIHLGKKIHYPIQAELTTSQCPEFDTKQPWTQKFLDDEIKGKERLFLQNHIMACDSCRITLHQTREIYYILDDHIKKTIITSNPENLEFETKLSQKWNEIENKNELTKLFKLSLIDFLKTTPVKILFTVIVVFFLMWLFNS